MTAKILRFVLCMGLLAFAGSAARAESPGEPSTTGHAAIRAVIEAQLAAFQADDGAKAFAFASPAIQGKFRSSERFMDMVRAAYRPVYRPSEVRFLDIVEVQGEPTQRVLLVGPDNELVTAYYIMQRQPDGEWRINGCILQRAGAQA